MNRPFRCNPDHMKVHMHTHALFATHIHNIIRIRHRSPSIFLPLLLHPVPGGDCMMLILRFEFQIGGHIIADIKIDMIDLEICRQIMSALQIFMQLPVEVYGFAFPRKMESKVPISLTSDMQRYPFCITRYPIRYHREILASFRKSSTHILPNIIPRTIATADGHHRRNSCCDGLTRLLSQNLGRNVATDTHRRPIPMPPSTFLFLCLFLFLISSFRFPFFFPSFHRLFPLYPGPRILILAPLHLSPISFSLHAPFAPLFLIRLPPLEPPFFLYIPISFYIQDTFYFAFLYV